MPNKTEKELARLSLEELILEVLSLQESEAAATQKAQEALDASIEASAKLDEALEENSSLREQVATLTKTKDAVGKETFDFNGEKYEILGSANIPNIGKRTPLEISQDVQAQEYLVQKGSGIIRKLA